VRTATLAQIAEKIDYGVTASAQAEPVGPKFLRITDIQDDTVDWDSVPFCNASPRERRDAELRAGDIVFARTGATTGKSYLIGDCPDGAVFASYLIRVRLGAEINPNYLARFFQSAGYWSQIASKSNGAAQPGVNASKLSELVVPLPPLPEQRRIAEILDQADALRRLRRQSLSRLSDLLVSYLAESGSSSTGPSSQRNLSRYFRNIRIGPFGSLLHRSDYVQGGIPLINPMHIQDGNLKPNSSYSVSIQKAETLSSYRVRAGEIIMGRRGEMGRAAIVHEEHEGMLCGTGSMVLTVEDDLAIAAFMADFLASPKVVSALDRAAGGVTMANLNTKSFERIFVKVPPIEQQREYVALKLKAQKNRNLALAASDRFDQIFASLQHRAFRGEL